MRRAEGRFGEWGWGWVESGRRGEGEEAAGAGEAAGEGGDHGGVEWRVERWSWGAGWAVLVLDDVVVAVVW